MENNNGALFKRIAAVMAAVRSLPKDGYNPQGNFNYVSSDTALDRIGKAMADNGLVIIPMLTDYETVDEPTGSGKARTRTRARFQMHICDGDGNAFLCPWAAEGIDYGNPDRALNKAMTNATKYFLLKLFVVGAGGDDPDGEATEPSPKGAERPAAQRVAQQPVKRANAPQRAATQPTQPPTAPPAPLASEYRRPAPAPEPENGNGNGKHGKQDDLPFAMNPQAAYAWAVALKASANEHAARNAFKRLVDAQFGGRLTAANAEEVYAAWFIDRMEKLARRDDAADKAVAAQANGNDSPPPF